MARTLIVYHSVTGTARRVAELLHRLTQWPVLEVSDAHPCGDSMGAGQLPEYRLRGPDAGAFDRLVVITPVWIGELAPPLRSLLRDIFQASQAACAKQVSLICVVGLDGVASAAVEVARLVGRPLLPLLILPHDDVSDASCMGSLQTFAEAIRALDGACTATAP